MEGMEMNAYKLADELEINAEFPLDDRHRGASMLRQQADRIAELEETINACYTVQKMQAEEVYKGNDRIAELENDLKKYDQLAWDDLNKSKTIWCACGDGITPDSGAKCGICVSTTPQTKPLSDEEIHQIFRDESGFEIDTCPIAILDFARAILKKASDI